MIILIIGLPSDHPFQVYYKVRQNMAREIEKSLLITNLVKLADELRMNPDTCGLANLIWIRYVWTNVDIFSSGKEKLQIQ